MRLRNAFASWCFFCTIMPDPYCWACEDPVNRLQVGRVRPSGLLPRPHPVRSLPLSWPQNGLGRTTFCDNGQCKKVRYTVLRKFGQSTTHTAYESWPTHTRSVWSAAAIMWRSDILYQHCKYMFFIIFRPFLLFVGRCKPYFLDNPLEWESMFNLWQNTAKSFNYIKKHFKQKLSKIKFSTKNSMDANIYLPQEWSYGAPKIPHFLNNALIWKSRFSLWLRAVKSTSYVEKCFNQK